MEPNTTIDHDPNEPAHGTKTTTRSWTKPVIIGAVAAVLLGGAGLATAMSSDGPGFKGRHGMGGGFGERRLERVLDEIDATDEQEKQIKAIIEKTGDELFPMAEDFRGTREEVVKLLSAPTVDRAAAETLRAQRIAKVDEASRKLTAAVLDVAAVLTPEQRAELADHFEDRGWGPRW